MTDQIDEVKPDAKPTFEKFEDYLATVEEPVKELYTKSVSGLKNALEGEREERKKLSEQVKTLLPKAEKGSELEGKLTETVRMLEAAEQRYVESQRRATFAEDAIKPSVNCSNVKAAYALAVSENLFTEDGIPRWADLKKLAPELFRTSNQTNAGNRGKSVANDINSAIRRAAGLNS